ncbi:hypothetical protein SLEP1_g466 [Rubroshorea leprosula]|uniref:3-beta hydroxysteroid dehydrogenase/isomerase domain-containing protein n=1 Tax=Rubroshorea leprosula TaxID=152421 RepID=A0AAV5HJZ5_9ROSI|nr:hypothetical protein SLEP1_g466 [Rubroshorea leprosula]
MLRSLSFGYSHGLKDEEPPEMVANKTINETLGILKACLKAKTVKRVVYTSSASAIFVNNYWNKVVVMDESFWSDVDFIRKFKPSGGSYPISKTLTKKAALEFAPKNGLDLVTLIPSIVGEKSEEYMKLLNASMVHVDDVAMAQIFLLEYPNATVSRSSLAKVQSFKAPGLSSKKLLESGFKFKYSVEEMLDDAIKCCKDKAYLK